MPNLALWLLAIAASAGASATSLLLLTSGRSAGSRCARVAGLIALALGLAVAYPLLGIRPAWPPTSGLGRWLLIVFPVAIGIEMLAAVERTPRWLGWVLRAVLSMSLVRILLHDSVYLSGFAPQFTAWQTMLVSLMVGAMLLVEWMLLARLAKREASTSIVLSIAMASLCGGIAVMVAGYITGGEAALPLAAALGGVAAAASWRANNLFTESTISIGTVGLYCLVLVGRFFGGISTETGLLVLFAPLLCYATELRSSRERRPWMVSAMRLALVSIPLVVVLVRATRDFDRKLRPLLQLREEKLRAHPLPNSLNCWHSSGVQIPMFCEPGVSSACGVLNPRLIAQSPPGYQRSCYEGAANATRASS